MLAESWGVGQVLWSFFWFTCFFIWIWLLVTVFVDIFRSPDLGGWAKALWTIFVIFLPYLGVFVYLIARGHKMSEHRMKEAAAQEQAMRSYVRETVQSSPSTASELERLAALKDQGVLTDAEFEGQKAKLLAP